MPIEETWAISIGKQNRTGKQNSMVRDASVSGWPEWGKKVEVCLTLFPSAFFFFSFNIHCKTVCINIVSNFDEEKSNVAAGNQGDVTMSTEGLSWCVAIYL